MKKPYNSWANKIPHEGESLGGISMVEPGESMTTKDVVERFMQAGMLRNLALSCYYEFKDSDEIPEDYYDPTRSPGFTFADAVRMAAQLQAKGKTVKDLKDGEAAADGGDSEAPVGAAADPGEPE